MCPTCTIWFNSVIVVCLQACVLLVNFECVLGLEIQMFCNRECMGAILHAQFIFNIQTSLLINIICIAFGYICAVNLSASVELLAFQCQWCMVFFYLEDYGKSCLQKIVYQKYISEYSFDINIAIR